MNPPPADDADAAAPTYAGAEPLDVALADRFAFVITVPSFDALRAQALLDTVGRAPTTVVPRHV